MSRSGYDDGCCDDSNWNLIRWRGAVNSAIRGKRGQSLLREMREAMDAMPDKRLVAEQLVCEDGVCALGTVAVKESAASRREQGRSRRIRTSRQGV